MSERRLVAYIRTLSLPPHTRHTIRRGGGTDERMPPAQLVLMEVEADGSAQIYRYTLDGEFAGDTWHQTQKEAEDQLVFEYGGKVGPWSEVPADVIDAHDFAVNWAQASRPEA